MRNPHAVSAWLRRVYRPGSWGVIAAIAGLYLLIGYKIGAVLYLAGWSILLALVSFVLLKWLNTEGAEAFSSL